MKLLHAALAMLVIAPAVSAQEPRPNQIALDVSYVGATVSYARRTSAHDLFGVAGGVAGHWAGIEIFGDDHFRDGDLLGGVHGGVLWRHQPSHSLDFDAGLQLGLMFHSGQNTALTVFGGPYATLLFGWRNVKFGPRLMGVYVYEDRDNNAVGLILDPVTARITIRF